VNFKVYLDERLDITRHANSLLNMPRVQMLWDTKMELNLALAVIRKMNFIPIKWHEIATEVGPAYSEYHCKYVSRSAAMTRSEQ
jgi:hypothetical protein